MENEIINNNNNNNINIAYFKFKHILENIN
jgi:hypothetical protein